MSISVRNCLQNNKTVISRKVAYADCCDSHRTDTEACRSYCLPWRQEFLFPQPLECPNLQNLLICLSAYITPLRDSEKFLFVYANRMKENTVWLTKQHRDRCVGSTVTQQHRAEFSMRCAKSSMLISSLQASMLATRTGEM
jgi:hypothetical protein